MPPICFGYSNIFGHLPYVWMPSCMFGCPHMFGHPLYVWLPLCLDAPYMFGHPLYVWMMFGCLLYIHNTKKVCFVILKECPYAPIHLDAPYFWMPPICLNAPISLDTPVCLDAPHMFGHTPCLFGCFLYVWMSQYVWTPPYVWTPSCMFGHHPHVCMP